MPISKRLEKIDESLVCPSKTSIHNGDVCYSCREQSSCLWAKLGLFISFPSQVSSAYSSTQLVKGVELSFKDLCSSLQYSASEPPRTKDGKHGDWKDNEVNKSSVAASLKILSHSHIAAEAILYRIVNNEKRGNNITTNQSTAEQPHTNVAEAATKLRDKGEWCSIRSTTSEIAVSSVTKSLASTALRS